MLGPSREGKKEDSEPSGDTLMLEVNKVGKHWCLGEGARGSDSGKGGLCLGPGKEIQHYWMDSKVREEVAMRPRGPVMKSLVGGMTDFEPFSSVIGVIEGITWSELY